MYLVTQHLGNSILNKVLSSPRHNEGPQSVQRDLILIAGMANGPLKEKTSQRILAKFSQVSPCQFFLNALLESGFLLQG